jgi:hypothetical protein
MEYMPLCLVWLSATLVFASTLSCYFTIRYQLNVI